MTATFTARFTVDRVVSLDPVDCVCVCGGGRLKFDISLD